MSAPLQSGLLDIKGWAAYMGSSWCGEPSDTERALEHSHQAVRYLLSGKDDCVRKATKVRAMHTALGRMLTAGVPVWHSAATVGWGSACGQSCAAPAGCCRS